MAERDMYTAEQLERIRVTLQETLGEESAQALENLKERFTPAQEESEDKEKVEKPEDEKKQVDVAGLVEEGRLRKMLASMADVKEDPYSQRVLVAAILRHRDVKAFHLVDALAKVAGDVELVNALVHGITSRKGVNPLIEALRYATASPDAMKSLAKGIADQGTSNHLIRAIATAPRNQPEAEIVWAMEVMGKGTMEQLLEAINLMDDASPGVVILATGVVNRKDVAIEPLVRALSSSKKNAKAAAILSVELTRLADIPSLITLLEKYISDATEAGEILTVKLVQRSLQERGRVKLLAKACRFMRGESMAGQILAWGIVEQGDISQLERAYGRMGSHLMGKKIIAVGLCKKVSGFRAFRLMGNEYFKNSKIQPAVNEATKKTKERYHWVLKNILGESGLNESKKSAKEEVIEKLAQGHEKK